MSTVVLTATRIRGYAAPDYLIEPTSKRYAGNSPTVDAINREGFEVVEGTVAGWGDHNVVIRVGWEDGHGFAPDGHVAGYYLATVRDA